MTNSNEEVSLDQCLGVFQDRIGLDWEAAYIAGYPTLSGPKPLPYECVASIWLEYTAQLFQEKFGMYPDTLIYHHDDRLVVRERLAKVAAELGGLTLRGECLNDEDWPEICFVYFGDPRGGDWDDTPIDSVEMLQAA